MVSKEGSEGMGHSDQVNGEKEATDRKRSKGTMESLVLCNRLCNRLCLSEGNSIDIICNRLRNIEFSAIFIVTDYVTDYVTDIVTMDTITLCSAET